MRLLSQAVLSGLMSGAGYSLLAIGMILIYRSTGVINLAHGEGYVIAGITCALLITSLALPTWLAAAIALIAAALFSLCLHVFLLANRMHWSLSARLLITLGVAFVVRGAMLLIAGIEGLSFPRFLSGPPIRVFGGALPWQGLALIVFGFSASIVVSLFLTRTDRGKQFLATAENPAAAALLGVNVETNRRMSYIVAGLLAGAAAILLVPLGSIDFQAGLSITLRGFIVAAVANWSPMTAIVAGLALGVFESFVGIYIGGLFQDPVTFAALIALAFWQSRAIRYGGGGRA